MDAKSLAEKLGVTPKTIWTRAKALGIQGSQVKTEGANGRPGVVYSPEECDRIANYGKSPKPTPESFSEDEGVESGALALQAQIATPLAKGFAQIASQIEAIEDQAANALTARVSAMPSRILSKVARNLGTHESLNLGEVFGILSAPAIEVSPIPMDSDRRKRFLECL